MTDATANQHPTTDSSSPSTDAASAGVSSSFKLSATAREFVPVAPTAWVPNVAAPVFNPSVAPVEPSAYYFQPGTYQAYQPQFYGYPRRPFRASPAPVTPSMTGSPALHPVKRKVNLSAECEPLPEPEKEVEPEPEPEEPQEMTWAQRLKMSAKKKDEEKLEREKLEKDKLEKDKLEKEKLQEDKPEKELIPDTFIALPSSPPESPRKQSEPVTEPAPIPSESLYVLDDQTNLEKRIYSMQFIMQFRDYAPVHRFAEVHAAIPPALLVAVQEVNWRDAPRREVRWKAQAAPVAPLLRAQDSWAANCKVGSEGDEAVERFIRGVLNKLTVEKFERLSKQLFSEKEAEEDTATTRMSTLLHLSILIKLLFEKATQQHHFIPMYAELCKRCADWLEMSWGPDAVKFFRTALIEHCQDAFDDFVNPPEDEGTSPVATLAVSHNLASASATERALKYRTKVWGNLKLVGRLIGQKIISSRIALRCVEELLSQGANDTLIEALAVFLTEVAPVVDVPEWSQYVRLEGVFKKLEKMREKSFADHEGKVLSSKVRFALVNLLELRSTGWKEVNDGKPQALAELHRSASGKVGRQREAPASSNRVVAGNSSATLNTAPVKRVAVAAPWARPSANLNEEQPLTTLDASPSSSEHPSDVPFELSSSGESARTECKAIFEILRKTGDSETAAASIVRCLTPLVDSDQVYIASHELIPTAAERSDKDRHLFLEVVCQALQKLEISSASIDAFKAGPYEELRMDVPKLPVIFEELVDMIKRHP